MKGRLWYFSLAGTLDPSPFCSNCTHLALFYLEVPCGLAPLIWLIGAIEADRVWREWRWGNGEEELATTRASYLLTDSYQSFHQGSLLESPHKGWCFLHFCLNTLHDKGFMVIMTDSAKSHVASRRMPPPGSFQSNFGENLLVRITGFQYLFPSTCFDWLPVTRLCHF